ncbi:alpha-L-iduronidase-like [Mercenaria mercenaria]|uniref:alpha-L-iduronidase-like n=1 Tax=Mercenaria mercenaria TaxID=6596 RepID=UPI00234F5023|nr:alpha-L-iduronidase-like [Mercenaria mercenaria]
MHFILTTLVSSLLMVRWVQPVTGMKIVVNSSVPVGELKHFWKSTGFCPPLPHQDAYKFDLSNDMTQNLALIGTVPHGGIKQVRIHWLFDLVTVISNEPFKPHVYNFTLLDNMMDLLYQNGLKPGFELMGNPSNIFTNFEEKSLVMNWKDLVTKTAQRYVDQYGLGYVVDWNFETWNEPDCHDFDALNMTVQGFLNYYDACSEGLKAVSDQLRLGGPGDGCRRSLYSDALLDHVVNGINYFTGERGVRIDFLAYHKKGSGSSDIILNDEISLMKNISKKYPSLANKPFYNDEADPLVGWSKDEQWRADSTYAAMVAKIVVQHQNHFISNPSPEIKNYTLLSNDNGFLSWYPHQFTQRTLLARFQINTTEPPHTHFFQKPVFSVMGLLSLLGEKQIQTSISDDSGRLVSDDGEFGVLSSVHNPAFKGTSDSWQIASLIYFSNDTGPQKGSTHVDVYMDINPPSGASQEMVLVSWILDNTFGNPYAIWEQYGKPDYPTLEQMTLMRGIEGAKALFNITVETGYQYLGKFFLQEPAVLLVHVCSKPSYQPDQPNNVNVYNITAGQVLITWSDNCVNSRCVLTYDIQYSITDDEGSYISIVPEERRKLATSFVYTPSPKKGISPDDQVVGFYKVRAIDYFINYSEFSLPTRYPDS